MVYPWGRLCLLAWRFMLFKAPSKYTRKIVQGLFITFMNLIFSFTKFWSLVTNFAEFYLFWAVGRGFFFLPQILGNFITSLQTPFPFPFPPSWRQTAPGIFCYFRRPTPTVVDGNTKPQRPFYSRPFFSGALSFIVPFTGTTAAATATTTNAIAPLSHRLLPFLSSR
jgi:hypothetical protein